MDHTTANSAHGAESLATQRESAAQEVELALDELDHVVGGLERAMMPPASVWTELGSSPIFRATGL